MKLIDEKTLRFSDAFNAYYPLIFSVICGKMNDADAAEDIAQEVFARFFEKFDEVDNCRGWLYGAMKNVIREYIRKSQLDSIDVDTLFEDISASYVNGFRDTRLMIAEALSDVQNFGDEVGRVLFDLIAIHNYSYKEAGGEVGISERQARYRYKCIVDKLVDHFRIKGIKGLEELL
jgi:RNA polymerase sigma factor (sigma-70 family)